MAKTRLLSDENGAVLCIYKCLHHPLARTETTCQHAYKHVTEFMQDSPAAI